MRSPGTYHLSLPRTLRDNLLARRELIRWGRRGRKYEKALTRMCARDIFFWIDAFGWQVNPKSVGTNSLQQGPFITWDFQREALEKILSCIDRGKDLVIEKSRDMGASWLNLFVMTWGVLFHPSKQFLCVSRNEKAVDSKSPDSLFWKIRYILDHCPRWMAGDVQCTELHIENPRTEGYIVGQAPTKGTGVGGRATAAFVDEFGQIREAAEIVNRTSDTTNCRIFNGTHLGTGTMLYELTDPDSMLGRYIEKFQMHWTDHPDKVKGAYVYSPEKGRVLEIEPGSYEYPADYEFVTDGTPSGGPHPGVRSPWYDGECKRKQNSRQVAMDLDIDPAGSAGTLFDPLMVRDCVRRFARDPAWEGDLLPDPDDDTKVTLSRRPGGPLRLWLNLVGGRPPADRYAFGVDNAHGSGATPSCASIVNSIGKKVGEYADPQVEPSPMASLFVPLCELFADADGQGAWLAWEIQGPGTIFGKRVLELGYRRVYTRKSKDETGVATVATQVQPRPGWSSGQPQVKDALLVAYRDALKDRTFVNPSERALKQTLQFQWCKDGHVRHSGEASADDYSGARANHGDMVIADALAWRMLVQCGGVDTAPGPSEEAHLGPKTLAGRIKLAHNAATEAPWCRE